MGDVEERAERLRVLIDLAPYLPMKPSEASEYLPTEDAAILEELGADDLALANACLAVEAEVQSAGFERLERLIAIATASQTVGSLDERLCELPDRAFARAASDLLALGWIE